MIMDKKNIICTVCPRGCSITIQGEIGKSIESISGFSCRRGEQYGADEFILPKRILTTTVKVEGGAAEPLLPVRSKAAIPRDLLSPSMEVIRKTTVPVPVRRGDVIILDILGCGVDIVASRSMDKAPAGK